MLYGMIMKIFLFVTMHIRRSRSSIVMWKCALLLYIYRNKSGLLLWINVASLVNSKIIIIKNKNKIKK